MNYSSMNYAGSSCMFRTNNPINIQSFSKRPFKQNGRGYKKLYQQDIQPLGQGFTIKINPKSYSP